MKTNIGIFIGRFNPPHLGHLHIIEDSLANNDKLIIVIGSHKSTFSPQKLLSTEQVQYIILSSVSKPDNIIFVSVRDNLYSDSEWISDVQRQVLYVSSKINKSATLNLYGYDKDQSSQYLKWFPNYNVISSLPFTINDKIIHATDIRNLVYRQYIEKMYVDINLLEPLMGNKFASAFLKELALDSFNRLRWICEEYQHYNNYKKAWDSAPYAPTFVTGDAVVICNNNSILLIKRKHSPGKDCYALPGGFINQNETIEQCILRELMEETKINVPTGKLRNSLRTVTVFDAPKRSLRGRTITHAGLIVLEEETLPKLTASDDAVSASWVPLHKLPILEDKFFEDHYHIILAMKAKLN